MREKTRLTKRSWVRRDSFLRSYLRKWGSHEPTATSPTPSSADRPEMLRPQELRRRYVNLLISQKRYNGYIRPRFSASAILRCKLPRGVVVSQSTEVKSSRMVLGQESSPLFTLQLGSAHQGISLRFERTSPLSLDYMQAELREMMGPQAASRSSERPPSSGGSSADWMILDEAGRPSRSTSKPPD